MGNFALGNGPVQRGQFIFNPPLLFAEFLATCRVDTVGMFAPMFGYAPGMYRRIVHEPFKAQVLPTAPARCPVGVYPVDCVLGYVIEYGHDSLPSFIYSPING